MKTSHSKFREDKPADGLHAVFASLLAQDGIGEPEAFYAKACECIGETMKAEPKDIMEFSNCLKPYRSKPGAGWKAGLFISALINGSGHRHFVLTAGGAGQPLDYLGFRNNKNLVVIGHAGGRLGWEMSGGSIYVDGDAGSEAGGRMIDGKIWVQGDAGERAGCCMRGGLLHIRGKPGRETGHQRQGGTILVGATAKTLQRLGAQPAGGPESAPKALSLPASAVMGTIEEMAVPAHHAQMEEVTRALAEEPAPCAMTAVRPGGGSLFVEAGMKSAKGH